jgi:hypothetical protein
MEDYAQNQPDSGVFLRNCQKYQNMSPPPPDFFDLYFCLDLNGPPLIQAQHVVLVSGEQ